MAARKQRSGGSGISVRPVVGDRTSADQVTAQRLKVVLGVLAMMAVAGVCVLGALRSEDDSTTVLAPASVERTDTILLLDRAYAAQRICYGWRLVGDSWAAPVSVGSNLGDNVAVDSDPARCPRWVEVTGDVDYASASSESSDSASYRVASSPDLVDIDFDGGLERLGVDPDQLIDDPGWAICRAAVILPLLVSESGMVPVPTPPAAPPTATPPAAPPTATPSAVPPVATPSAVPPTATPSAVPPVATPSAGTPSAGVPSGVPSAAGAPTATSSAVALPDPGNDFWRNRWVYLLGAGGLFLLTALFLAIGWFERRHQRRPGGRPGRSTGSRGGSAAGPSR